MKVFYFLFLPFLACVTVMLVDLNEHGQATAWTMIAFLFTLFCLAVAIVIACRNWAKQSKARQNRTIL